MGWSTRGHSREGSAGKQRCEREVTMYRGLTFQREHRKKNLEGKERNMEREKKRDIFISAKREA
jgi:hypothetical protein